MGVGDRIVVGGECKGSYEGGAVIAGVTPGMRVLYEEVFGPVAPVMTFDSDESACALVNESPYGLAAAIHSGSTERALKIANRIQVGMVHINDQTVNNEFQVPFGGMGSSGNSGRFGGPANIEEFTTSQWISVLEEGIPYPF